MNARIVIAQAGSTPTGTPVQTIKVVKPAAGHTEIFHASFNGTVKVDFSAIANEKITLYHDNADQSLHIIFADGSQAIIEPFFDSMGVLGNLIVEVAPGQDLDGVQFASQFPITTDQSVLPAAGEGVSSGADFSNPSVDPLSAPGPLALLPPEELPPIVFNEFLPGALPETITPLTLSGSVTGIVEEEQLHFHVRDEQSESGAGNEDKNDLSGNDDDTNSNKHITTKKFSGDLSSLVASHDGTLTFGFANVEGHAVTTTDDTTPIKSLGQTVRFHIVSQHEIDGVTDDGRTIFKLVIDNTTTGHFTFKLTDQIDHPDQSHDDGHNKPGIFEETLDIDLSGAITVHDQVNPAVTLHPDSFTVGVIDDTPILTGEHEHDTVDEDDINTHLSQGTSPNDGNSDGSFTGNPPSNDHGPATVYGQLSQLVRVGADAVDAHNHGTFSITEDAVSYFVSLGLESQGQPLSYELDGDKLIAFVNNEGGGEGFDPQSDRHVFTFELTNEKTGKFEFKLFDQLDHVPGNGENTGLVEDSEDGHLHQINFGHIIDFSDADGDSINLDHVFTISVRDDVPTVQAELICDNTVVIDESAGKQDDDTNNANVAHLFDGVNNPGVDPDMTLPQFARNDNNAPIVDANIQIGADEPGTTHWLLQLHASGESQGGPVDSGLQTTEGQEIFLFKEGGLIVGRYSAGEDEPAAFAIDIDDQGRISIAQYVSIHNPNPADPDDTVFIAQGIISAKVVVTDFDGDKAGDAVDLGGRIGFSDDGPTVSGVTQFGSDLIVNGSFEQGHNDLGSPDWNIYKSIPGWTWGSDHIPFEVQTGGAGGQAAEDGNALVELDGDTTGNPAHTPKGTPDPNNTDATIQQHIHGTVAGETYELTFFYAPRPGHAGGNDSGMDVLWNGNVVHSFDSSTLPDGFLQYTFTVIGTGHDTLAFQGTGTQDEFGALLDNVSLRAIDPILDDEDTTLNGAGIQGGPGDDGSGVVASGDILFNAGADGLKSIEVHGIDGLQAIYVDTNGIGHPESVTYNWTPDGSGGGTLTGSTADLPTVFTMMVDSTGHYTFTLVAPLDHPSHDDPNTGVTETSFEDNLNLGFGFTITDGDDDTANGTITINVDDDSPTISLETNSGTVVIHDETPGLQSANDATDVAGATSITFNGGSTTVASLFAGVVDKGNDHDVSHDLGGAIGYAQGLDGLVDVNVHFGADGEAASQGEVFALQLPGGNGTDSGLKTTGGQEIYLFLENGVIVGRIDPDNNIDQHDAGDLAAFAITVDPATGKVYVAQYLSLEHFSSPDAGGDISEADFLASGTVSLAVTATDGDGDSVTQAADVSGEIRFLDDGPTVTVNVDRNFSVVLDETPGLQTFPFGDDNDFPFHSLFFSLPSEVRAQFDGVANTGNDPDVSDGAKDHDDNGRGAINFAWNFLTPALDVHAVFGADGPAQHNSEAFSLTLNGASGSVDSGIKTTDGHEIYLTLENGVIVGRVLADGHTSVTTDDQAAFAIAIDDDGRVATAEYLSLYHNSPDTGHDSDEAVALASGTVSATVTVTDGDGDTASASADISGAIQFEDDGPSVSVDQAGSFFRPVDLSQLTLDESIHQLPGDSNATGDNVAGVTAPTLLTTPIPADAIGIVSTPASSGGTSVAELFDVNINFGADGPDGPDGQPAYNYSLTLKDDSGHVVSPDSSTGVETNLVVTELAGGALQGTTDAQRTIYLFLASDGSIIGRVGDDPNGDVALHIVITGSPSDPQITVEQYLPIEHPTANPDEPAFLTFDDHDASLGITLAVTATDGDLDTATDSKTITLAGHNSGDSFIRIEDDGPTITSAFASATVIQDETPGVQNSADPNPENDVAGSGLPAGVLDLFNDIVNHGTDLSVSAALLDNGALGFATSASPVVVVNADFGTDGAAVSGAEVFSLAINGGQGADSGLQTTDGHEIYLQLETYGGVNLIVGRVDGDGDQHVSTADPAAFAIELGQDGNISVAQYLSLNNPDAGSSAADQDEPVAGLKNVQAVVTLTDGDGDHAAQTVDISGNIVFQDDGPTLTVTTPDSVANSFFFDGFVENGNAWGTGSGINAGPNSGGWTIADANDGHSSDLIPNTGSGGVQLERVGDGYNGTGGIAMHSSTGGFMVDLDASPHDVKISQVINGLNGGESYALTFEAGAPFPGEAHLQVWFGGQLIDDIAPTGTMTTYTVELFGDSGDQSNLLEFRETGTPDNQGTYLANVKMADVIVIDETPGVDSDSNDTLDPNVAALFTGVANVGSDPDMGSPQFATGTTPAVIATPNFGADGPKDSNHDGIADADATVYSLTVVDGTDSGLATTEGKMIELFNEGGIVVGRFDSDNSGTINSTDQAAFAFTIGSDGVVSVAQYVSLEHPDQANSGDGFNSYDEGIYLNSGTLSATVTITDGDGDTASGSADISGAIRFEDDGPTVSGVTQNGLGPELIVNGGFEDGHTDLTASDWSIYSSLPGWTAGADNIPFEVQTGGIGGVPGDTTAVIELDGDTTGNGHAGQATPDPNGHTDATIQQHINGTEAGQSYELTFSYAPRPDHAGGNDSGMNVLWNGTIVHSFDSSTLPDGFQQYTFTVTGTGDDTLGFQATGAEDEFGALLDNVSLRATSPVLDDEDTTLSPAVEIQGGPGDDGSGVTASGQIEFNAGADGLKAIQVNGSIDPLKAIWVDGSGIGHPESVTQTWVPDGLGGGTLIGTSAHFLAGNPVFTLAVGADGTYTFTLDAPLDHPLTDDPATTDVTETSFEDNLLLNFGFTVTDGDGDQAPGTLTINVDDDSPEFGAGGIADATVTTLNTPVTESLNLVFGADGEHANGNGVADGLKISGWTNLDGVTETLSSDGTTLTATVDGNPLYVLQLNTDGTYTFTQDAALPGSSSVLPTETLSDSYGPVTSHDYGDFTLTGLNGGSMNGSAAGAGVNDNDMNVGDAFNVTFDNQMQSATLGIDFAGNGTLHLHWVALAQDGTTVIGSGDTAGFNADGSVTITPPGGFYQLDLTVDLDSDNENSPKFKLTSIGGDTEGSNPLDHLTFQVAGTDGDGDQVGDSFSVNLETAPPLSASGSFTGTVEEEQLGHGSATDSSGFVGNEDTDSALGNDHDTSGDSNVTTNLTFVGLDNIANGVGPFHVHFNSTIEGQQAQFTGGTPLTSNGKAVYFHIDGSNPDLLIGYADGASGTAHHYDAANDRVVFTLQITTDTFDGTHLPNGQGTFTLYDNVDDHTVDNAEGTRALDLDGVVQVTDSVSTTVDLPGSIDIIDDTPIITASGTASTLTVDETNLSANDTESFAASFTSSFGADGAGTISYALGVVAGASGLVDTATGQAVNLVLNGDVVEGRTAGSNDLVFTVSVDGSGNVTLDQDRAVVHPTADPDESTSLSAADLVTLTATITDGDGDSQSAVLDIGQDLVFKDDGPSIIASGTVSTLTVDETDLSTDASASFAASFTSSFGADGAGTISYALGVVAGASGLVDTATGQAVNLVLNGDVVEGRTAGSNDLVFTVSVDGSGNVTLDQDRAVVHPTADPDESTSLSAADLVTLTATITDGDGDSQSAVLDIGQDLVFKDDAPTAGSSATVVLDDESADNTYAAPNLAGDGDTPASGLTGTLAHSFGADGPGTVLLTGATLPGVDFTSSVSDGGRTLTISQEQDGHSVDVIKVTLSDDTSGGYTVDQLNPVFHPTSSTTEEDVQFTVNYAVKDGDGDTTPGSFTIDSNDDTPVANGESRQTTEGSQPTTNLTLVIDTSGSMGDNPGVAGFATRLDLAKAAAIDLINSANVNQIMVVDFASGADHNTEGGSVWTDKADAISYINSLSAGGNTNYEAALNEVTGNWGSGPTAADQNLIYFLSDGQPNPSGDGIDTTRENAWINFLNNPDTGSTAITNVFAVGIGSGLTGNENALEPVAWTPGEASGTHTTAAGDHNVFIVTDESQLSATLTGTLTGAITGNVLDNDSFGADGPHTVSGHFDGIVSITVDNHVYTFDGSTISLPGGNPAGATASGATLTVDTLLGGHLSFDFGTGGYSYTPPVDVSATTTETFHYVIADGDGDQTGADLAITVHDTVPMVATDDTVLTNIVDGSSIEVPSAAMLFNDVAGSGPGPLHLTSVQDPVGGTVTLGSAIFTPDPTGPQTLIDENFDGKNNVGGFTGRDNAFRGTTENNEDEDHNNDALRVTLGGSSNPQGPMSGAWEQNFTLATAALVTISFDYELDLSGKTGNNENGQALMSVDGTLHGTGGNDYIAQLLGNSNNSSGSSTDGHFEVTLSLGAGIHTLDLGAYMTSENSSDETTQAHFDNVQVVAAGHSFSSGAYDYTATDGKTSDDAHVTIAAQNGGTVTGTDANEILIASDRHVQVDAAVHSGDTKSADANDAFSFHFTGDASDVSITQIQINVSGIGHFDQGSGGRNFDLGSNSDVTPASVTSGDTDVLTLSFTPGAFTAGEQLLFGIDTDGAGGHDLDNGGDFGDESVPFTVTLSDGTILSGDYQSNGSASDATFSSDLGTALNGMGGDDYLVSSAAADNLTGGTGADHFFYNAPTDGNDIIHDFSHADGDTIDVLLSGFAGLSAGPVADADFVVSNNADTVNLGGAHFAYNETSGQLYYDGNGGGVDQRVLLATIENHAGAGLVAGDVHAV